MLRHFLKMGILLNFLIIFVSSIALAEELRDVKSPLPLPPPDRSWSYILLGILAAVVVFFLIRLGVLKPIGSQPKKAAPQTPWDMAYRQLQDLEKLNLPQTGRIKEYYIRLSDIMRQYIENRFGIEAMDMTTEEFLQQLKYNKQLNTEQKLELKAFLSQSDLVKFAKYQVIMEEMNNHFQFVQKFIDTTKVTESVFSSVGN